MPFDNRDDNQLTNANNPARLAYSYVTLEITGDSNTFTLKNPLSNVTEIKMESCSIPHSWFNIFLNVNNTFRIRKNGAGSYESYAIPAGNYGANEICNAIDAKIIESGAALTTAELNGWISAPRCFYNTATGKFEVRQIMVTVGTTQPAPTITGRFDMDNAANTLGNYMALPLPVDNVITVTSSAIPILNKNISVYLRSRALTEGSFADTSLDNFISALSIDASDIFYKPIVDVNAFFYIQHEPFDHKFLFTRETTKRLHNIDLRLTFKDGSPVNLNGLPYSITLRVGQMV